MRILLYSHDAFGLGNIRRNYALATHLVRRQENIKILLLTCSRWMHLFPAHPRIEYVKLPEVRRAERGVYVSRSRDLSMNRLSKLRREILRGAARGFNPDLFLVDKVPLGIEGELESALGRLRERGTRVVLLLRDVVDEPDWVRERWGEDGQYDALTRFFREIWIFGDKGVYATASEYGLDELAGIDVRYCGYLRRPAPAERNDLPPDGRGLITVGGGEDGLPVLEAAATALESLSAPPPVDVVLGPFTSEATAAVRERFVRLDACRVHEYVPDLPERMARAPWVVSMGGYNSVCEVLGTQRPALIVPRRRPSREQVIRADRMTALGFFKTTRNSDFEDIAAFLNSPRQESFPRPAMTGLLRAGYLVRG